MSQRRWLATAVIFRPSNVSLGFAETWTVIAPATAETLEGGSRALVRRRRKPVDQWLSETAAPICHVNMSILDEQLNMHQPVTSNFHQRHLGSGVCGSLIVLTKTVGYGPCSFAVAVSSTWNALPAPLRNDKLCHFVTSWTLNYTSEHIIHTSIAVWLSSL